MTQLENIVRPFQRREVTYPVRVFDDQPSSDTEDVVLNLGQEGATKAFNESFNNTVNSYEDETSREQSRKTHEKRVENPDDPSQFVNVEVIDKLTVKAGTGKKYQKTNFEFDNP